MCIAEYCDAYKIGDKVKYQGAVWESKVNANTYAPGIVPGQWTKLYDL